MLALFMTALVSASPLACSSSNDAPQPDKGSPNVGAAAPDDSGRPIDPSTDGGATPSAETSTPTATSYPPPPYGLAVGDTFPNLTFNGYERATGPWTSIAMADYYDPDGSKKVYGIYVVVGAVWCGACNDEADVLSQVYPKLYRDRGGVILSAIIENGDESPATQSTVDLWIKAHHVNNDIVSDGAETTLPKSGEIGLPYTYLVNPRTMKIEAIPETASTPDGIPPLDALMKKNGAP